MPRVPPVRLLLLLLLGVAACDVDQAQDSELPDVDVEGSTVPEYDVDSPDIDFPSDSLPASSNATIDTSQEL